MGLLERFRRTPLVPDDVFSPMPGFRVIYGEETHFVTDAGTLDLMREGRAQRSAQEQFYVLDMLAEEARATPRDDGFTMPAEEIAHLEDADASIIGMPPRFSGALTATVQRWTASPDFQIELEVQVGAHPVAPDRRGPVIRAEQVLYRLSVPLLRALRAAEAHAALDRTERTETENVRLVAQLQSAQRLASDSNQAGTHDEHFRLSLGALDRFATVEPTKVGLIVESQDDGSLVVEPDLGNGLDDQLLTSRWHQLDRYPNDEQTSDDHSSTGLPANRYGGAVLRVNDTLVLLTPEQLAGVQEVRGRPRIPADQVKSFLQAPGSYFDPDLVDVDIRFSVRVAGLGILAPITFDYASSSGIDWFGKLAAVSAAEALADVVRTPGEQESLEIQVNEAWDRGESIVTVNEQLIDISDHPRVLKAFAESRRRIAELELAHAMQPEAPPTPGPRVTVGMHIVDAASTSDQLRKLAARARPQRPVDYTLVKRTPFPHQKTGIEWMTGLIHAALDTPSHIPTRIQGALLADDMGLGKTFMTLAALGEAQRSQREAGRLPLPVLAVMPLALLETWLNEIDAAFGSAHGPFDDVVILQGRGLVDYRVRGIPGETEARLDDLDDDGMVRTDRIHVSLRVGPTWGEARLDRPGVLVLTTYEALRRYQVSLGLVEWGVVVLDEAQATKNPEILTTRAAKALNARFKLLATGTPVENSLRDFWSLIDTAQPGLLGTWAEFQSDWVTPMAEASGLEHERLGRALRDAVGSFMLRRVKEDHLEDLPPKQIHEYRRLMPPVQVQSYDEVLAHHRAHPKIKGAALTTLNALAAVSLHPGLLTGPLDGDPATLEQSARTLVTVRTILDEIRTKGEKAIVFAKRKELQRALALWLCDLYEFRVDIVNGDTATTGRSETRMSKIRAFEARGGFNVIILSPLAAGVGLTIVGANHAIHLERHWNPAKEAQATDRIHRIGQQREVHVHYPVALHPAVDSFDVNLDRLLRNKTALKDAVVVPQEVTQDQLERALGLA